jgi:hypothetical protein
MSKPRGARRAFVHTIERWQRLKIAYGAWWRPQGDHGRSNLRLMSPFAGDLRDSFGLPLWATTLIVVFGPLAALMLLMWWVPGDMAKHAPATRDGRTEV